VYFTANDDGTVHTFVSVGFVQSGTATNYGVGFDLDIPNILTAAIFNLAIQQAISDYNDSTYSTSTNATDVILSGAVVAI
jgi:hypothetical protein